METAGNKRLLFPKVTTSVFVFEIQHVYCNTHRQLGTWHRASKLTCWHVTGVSPSSIFTHLAQSLHLSTELSDSQHQPCQLLYLFSPRQMFRSLWLLPSLLTISIEGPLSLYIRGPLQHDNDKGCPCHLLNEPPIPCLVADKRRQHGGTVGGFKNVRVNKHIYAGVTLPIHQFSISLWFFFAQLKEIRLSYIHIMNFKVLSCVKS